MREEHPPSSEAGASPLPSLRKEGTDYFSDTAVSYGTDGTDDEDLMDVFEQDNQPSGIQSQDNQQNNQPSGNQSQGIHQNNQPSGSQETRTQTIPPVLTQQGVLDLVSNDAINYLCSRLRMGTEEAGLLRYA